MKYCPIRQIIDELDSYRCSDMCEWFDEREDKCTLRVISERLMRLIIAVADK